MLGEVIAPRLREITWKAWSSESTGEWVFIGDIFQRSLELARADVLSQVLESLETAVERVIELGVWSELVGELGEVFGKGCQRVGCSWRGSERYRDTLYGMFPALERCKNRGRTP